MKLNKIILGLTVCAGLFTACTSEELVDNGSVGEDTTFGITVSSSDPATKAAAGYTYATDEEITLNNVVVAVFKMSGTNTVGAMVSTPIFKTQSQLTTTSVDGKVAYSLTDLVGKTGAARILVIGNIAQANISKYTNCTSWEDFVALTENVADANSFSASTLVKVGYLDVNLQPASTKTSYVIPLAQLAARVDIKINSTSDNVSFKFNKVTVDNVNTASDVLLTSANSQSNLKQATYSFTTATDTCSFYSFENTSSNFVKVTLEGTITESDVNYTGPVKYSFILDKTKLSEGLVHGTIFHVVGTLDASTRHISFHWNILPWSTTMRNVYVDIIKSSFLVVKDLNITMPNITTFSTSFDSSSPVTIINKTVTNGTNSYASTTADVVADADVNSGAINITSSLPVNFVPKYITFTVQNEEGLTATVHVVQYPPIYITTGKSLNKVLQADDNQNNRDVYAFKALVADYSSFPYPDNIGGSNHYNSSQDRGNGYTDAMRKSALIGFPTLESVLYDKYDSHIYDNYYGRYFSKDCYVYSHADGKDVFYNSSISALSTVESTTNNNFVSPNFILASQNGMNLPLPYYNQKKEFCAGYSETVYQYNEFGQPIDKYGNVVAEYSTNHYSINYGQGQWRVPTMMEIYMIDILQNYKKCAVQDILEGGYYWATGNSKNNGQMIEMMDPRTGESAWNANYAAVRCVHDMK